MIEFSNIMNKLHQYVPGKSIDNICEKTGLKPEQVIKLASNENPLGPPVEVVEFIKQKSDKVNIYPDRIGISLLKQIGKHFGFNEENIFIGNGSSEIVDLLCKALLNPTEEAITFKYEFSLYKTCVISNRGIIKEAQILKNFKRNIDDLLPLIDRKTKIIFIANPNNPTGDLIDKEELITFIEKVPKNILIAIDEAYIEYIDESLSLIDYLKTSKRENLVILRTFSKIYALAGLRVGYCFGHKNLINALRKIKLPVNVPYLSQKGCEMALNCSNFKQVSKRHVEKEKERIRNTLIKYGIEFLMGNGNFYLIKDKKAENTVFELEKKGIIVRSLNPYGISNYFRVTVGKKEENDKFLNELYKLTDKN